MISFFKNILFGMLSQDQYLNMLHKGFNIVYKMGLLKNDYIYKYHYYVRNLIKEGDVVVDLGANLGYYTRIFSSLVGDKGRVIAVEPVPPFYKAIMRNLGSRRNVMVHNVALGEEVADIFIEIPNNGKFFRSGLAQIKKSQDVNNSSYLFDVKMVRGSELLQDVEKIDYIKCDIEGYEQYVVLEIKAIIAKHRPILQIESYGEGKKKVDEVMQELDYEEYSLIDGRLQKDLPKGIEAGDFIFLPKEKAFTL